MKLVSSKICLTTSIHISYVPVVNCFLFVHECLPPLYTSYSLEFSFDILVSILKVNYDLYMNNKRQIENLVFYEYFAISLFF